MKPSELNIETMKKLYDFGGLIAHRVKYFSPAIFSVEIACMTFNEDEAKRVLKGLQNNGFTAGIESLMIKFDGAFSAPVEKEGIK